MLINLLNCYVIKTYKENKFIGFVKSYRKHRNGKYRFERTKNTNLAIKFISNHECRRLQLKLSVLKDPLRYNNSYSFTNEKITDQDIRLSKLTTLNSKKIKSGIFKNKNL